MNYLAALLPGVFLIGGFILLSIVWRNRRQRALRREMKRHLQGIAVLQPYDPTNP